MKINTNDTFEIDFGHSPQDATKYGAEGLATILREHVKEMGWGRRDQARWAKAFEMLIKEKGHGVVVSRLKEYVRLKLARPRCRNGDEFRTHWEWVGQEVERANKPQALALGPQDKELLDEITGMGWPERTLKDISTVLAVSLANVTAFRAALKGCCDITLSSACRELLSELGGAQDHLRWYFATLHRKYAKWPEWSGNLMPHAWSPARDPAAAFLRGVLVRWAGSDDGSFDKVLEELK